MKEMPMLRKKNNDVSNDCPVTSFTSLEKKKGITLNNCLHSSQKEKVFYLLHFTDLQEADVVLGTECLNKLNVHGFITVIGQHT